VNINNTLPDGFRITIETVPKEGPAQACPVLFPKKLGEQIAGLIGNELLPGSDLHLIVRIENWNETFDHEETVHYVKGREQAAGANYIRNYWIETPYK
jgi:hypothetical protein